VAETDLTTPLGVRAVVERVVRASQRPPIRKALRIATVCVVGQVAQKSDNRPRATWLRTLVTQIEREKWNTDILLLPGGFFRLDTHLGHLDDGARIAMLSERSFSASLRRVAEQLGCLVACGVDSVPWSRPGFPDADWADQLCTAVNEDGLVGLGRKIFPTPGEADYFVVYRNDFGTERRLAPLACGDGRAHPDASFGQRTGLAHPAGPRRLQLPGGVLLRHPQGGLPGLAEVDGQASAGAALVWSAPLSGAMGEAAAMARLIREPNMNAGLGIGTTSSDDLDGDRIGELLAAMGSRWVRRHPLRPRSRSTLGRHARGARIIEILPQTGLPATPVRSQCATPHERRRDREPAPLRAGWRAVVEGWGVGRHLSGGRGVVAVFSSPPGTGKTLCAEVVAAELNRPLLRTVVSGLLSKWVGETERHLERLFDDARRHNAVILLDEVDALLMERGVAHATRHDDSHVACLLDLLERHDGVVLMATNRPTVLDPALERRVGWRIEIPPPDERARAAIWARLLPPGAPTDGSVDVDRLAARHPIAGGLFRTAVFRACYRAAAAGGAITHNLLDEAAAEQSGVEAEPRFRPRVVGGGVRKPRRRS
jgi:hypothetical protein